MSSPAQRLIAAFLVAAVLFGSLAPHAAAQSTEQMLKQHRATLIEVEGDVTLRKPGAATWEKPRKGQEVRTGDRIRTGPRARVRVEISDVGSIVLKPGSEVTVGKLEQIRTPSKAFLFLNRMILRDDVEFDLGEGDIRASFEKRDGRVGNYNVYTPVCVAGVRGTKFDLDLEGGSRWYEQMDEGKGDGEPRSLTTTVFEGLVELAGGTWTRDVPAGQTLTAFEGVTPGNPTNAERTRLDEISTEFRDQVPPTFSGAHTMTRVTATSATIKWNPATDDKTSSDQIVYEIHLAMAAGAENLTLPTATTEPGATSYTFQDLLVGGNYYAIVRARDSAGNRDQNRKEVSTAVADDAAPAFDGAVSLERPTPTSIKASWSSGSDDRTPREKIVYDLYLATEKGAQNFAAATASSEPGASFAIVDGLEPKSDYYVVVRARDESGNRDANRREFSTREEVLVPPQFQGVIEGREVVEGTYTIQWKEASDNKTSSSNIIYDIYVSLRPGMQNFRGEPRFSTSPGVTRHSFSMPDNPAPAYYVVVRARDEAGNRDENLREFAVRSPTFIGAAIRKHTRELFEAYSAGQTSRLLQLVAPGFSGMGISGSMLTSGTIREAIESDMRLIETANYDATVTSVEEAGGGRRAIAHTSWNARIAMKSGGKDIVKSGEKTRFAWDISEVPFRLAGWEGAAPFGHVEPLTVAGGPPRLDDIQGNTNWAITGDYLDLSGTTLKVVGTNFQQGSILQHYENERGWENVAELGNTGPDIDVTYISPTELRVDFRRMIIKYRPDDKNIDDRFRIVNPNGELSNELTKRFHTSPGPFRIVGLSLEGGPEFDPASTGRTRYLEVDVFNFVIPDRNISSPGFFFLRRFGQEVPGVQFMGARVVEDRDDANPIRLRIELQLNEPLEPQQTYDLVLRDARGLERSVPFRTGQAAAPVLLSVDGNFEFHTASTTEFAPRTFNARGTGFPDGGVLEEFSHDFAAWHPFGANNTDPNFQATQTRVNSSEIRVDFSRMSLCWYPQLENGVHNTNPMLHPIRFRVRTPNGAVSNEISAQARIHAGNMTMSGLAEQQPVAGGSVSSGLGAHYFRGFGKNWVFPVQIVIADAGSIGTPSLFWQNIQVLGAGPENESPGQNCTADLILHFSAQLVNPLNLPLPAGFHFTFTESRGQSATFYLPLASSNL